jgi:hypothetical protein
MKKQLLFLTFLAAVATASCSKNNSATPTVKVAAKFTFRGKAYTSKKLYASSSTTLDVLTDSAVADDNSTKVLVNFVFRKGNSDAGSYTIVGGNDNTPAANQVALLVSETSLKNTQNVGIYTSLAGGTLVLSGSGSSFACKSPSVDLKGQYYDNTDPHNTQITEVSTTISAATFTQN